MTICILAERHKICPFLVLFQNDFLTYKESVDIILFRRTLEVFLCKFWLNLRLHYVMTSVIFISFESEF